ncbi:MAG: hypothetical protein ACKOYM_02030 [Actinomycetes bacterium]
MTSDTTPSGWRGSARTRAVCTVVACVGASFLVWLPSLFAGFTGDDLEGILRATAGQRRFAGLDYAAVQWRPLSNASLQLDHAIWGLDASGYHLTNGVLNGLAAALVVALTVRLWKVAVVDRGRGSTVPPWAPGAIAGSLFLLLPSHSEAVAWIGGRGDLLVAVTALSSLLAWWAASDAASRSHRVQWTALAAATLTLALLAKETAATWPLVVSAFEVTRRWSSRNGRRIGDVIGDAARPWPLYVVAAGWFGVRWITIGQPFGSYGTDALLSGGVVGVLRHAVSVLVRSTLPAASTRGWIVVAAVVALLLFAAGSAARRPSGSSLLRAWPVAFLPSAMVVCSVPVLGLGTSLTEPIGERLGYLPSTFACVLVAWGLCAVLAARPAVGWAMSAGLAATLLVACVTAQGRWVAAGNLADRLFDSAAQLPRDQPVVVLNAPDYRDGTYVALNALPAALALQHGWTDLTAVWAASTYTQGANGSVSVVPDAGQRTWTVRLRGRDARFVAWFPRERSANRSSIEVRQQNARQVRVTVGPPPNGAVEQVWMVDDGRLIQAPLYVARR